MPSEFCETREEQLGLLAATDAQPSSAQHRAVSRACSLMDLPNDALHLIFQELQPVDQECLRTANHTCHRELPPVFEKAVRYHFSNVGRSRARWVWAVSSGLIHPAFSIFDQDRVDRSGLRHRLFERPPAGAELPYCVQLSAFTTRYGRLAGCCMLTCWRSYAERGIFHLSILFPLWHFTIMCYGFALTVLIYIDDWKAQFGVFVSCAFVLTSSMIFIFWALWTAVARRLKISPDVYYECLQFIFRGEQTDDSTHSSHIEV